MAYKLYWAISLSHFPVELSTPSWGVGWDTTGCIRTNQWREDHVTFDQVYTSDSGLTLAVEAVWTCDWKPQAPSRWARTQNLYIFEEPCLENILKSLMAKHSAKESILRSYLVHVVHSNAEENVKGQKYLVGSMQLRTHREQLRTQNLWIRFKQSMLNWSSDCWWKATDDFSKCHPAPWSSSSQKFRTGWVPKSLSSCSLSPDMKAKWQI